MSKVEWKDEYNLGCEEIDCEHRIFVRIIQKIEDAVEKNTGHYFVVRLLSELDKYAVFHFLSEENVMICCSYPDIIQHKHEHEQLLATLRELILKVELKEQPLEDLSRFLVCWFRNHTLTEDQKLVEYFNKQ